MVYKVFPQYMFERDQILPFPFDEIHFNRDCFINENGHQILIRGANLSEKNLSTKILPVDFAKERFMKLKREGITAIRLQFTWNSIEPTACGQFDENHLDYIENMMRAAYEVGLFTYLDLNLDHWKGAPTWTKELVGFDPLVFNSIIEEGADSRVLDEFHTGLIRDTMNTLFYASEIFAPNMIKDGISIGEHLRRSYCKMLMEVTKRARNVNNLLAINLLDRPSTGYIDVRNLKKHGLFNSMLQGEGLNSRLRAWSKDSSCIWRKKGIWSIKDNGKPVLIKKHHFRLSRVRKHEYLSKFFNKAAQAVHSVSAKTIISVGTATQTKQIEFNKVRTKRALNTPHTLIGELAFGRITKGPVIFLELTTLLSRKRKTIIKKAENSLINFFYPPTPKSWDRTEFIRPYPQLLIGHKHRMSFNVKKARFSISFQGRIKNGLPLVIFLPHTIYKHGFNVKHSPGRVEFIKENSQLYFYPHNSSFHKIIIERELQEDPRQEELWEKSSKGQEPF